MPDIERKPTATLTPKARYILDQIAQGSTYEAVAANCPGLAFMDISSAVREALSIIDQQPPSYNDRLAKIKQRCPRAYEPWSPEEDRILREMVAAGVNADRIAEQLKRQPSAIRNRLNKQGL